MSALPDARPGGSEAAAPYSLRALSAYMPRLGTVGFGGPVALAGYMHRDLAETRKRITIS